MVILTVVIFGRVRIGSCGIVDVLLYDTRPEVATLQQEDLAMFGRVLFALCCGNLAALNTLPKALDTLSRMYSADVKSLALYLVSKPGPHKVIFLRLVLLWCLTLT